jgi:hypothetical protein
MLTFERLVQETAQKLASVSDIRPETVRDVLTDTGIDDCLRDTAPAPLGRLVIHSITIIGEKRGTDAGSPGFKYHRTLGSGLWAWVGGNGTGKSTIMNCIVWALTGSDAGVPKRVRPWIHDVLVQLTVGDEPFTSHVSREGEGISGGIYRGFLTLDQIVLGTAEPFTLYESRDEMRECVDAFFMQHLGITTLRWTAHSAKKDDPDLHAHSTTWRTYAHAIHIQDDSYDDLIIDPTKGFGRQDRKILEMMLGVEQSRAAAEIQVQADFAKQAYGRARARASGQQSSIGDQIAALEQERLEVQQTIGTMENGQAPVESDTVFAEKRERRAMLLSEQNRLVEEIASLEAQADTIEQKILQAEREKVALQEQGEVEYLINSLVVVRCPHCETAVDDKDRLAMERQNHTCHVCAQPVQRARTHGDLKVLLRERDKEVASLRTALRRVRHDLTDRKQRLSTSHDVSAQIGRELEANVRQARDGFSETYTRLLVRKGQIDGQLEQLRKGLSQIDAAQTEVETAARWNLILQTAAEIADETVFAINEDVFARLGALVVKLATQFGIPDLEQVVIDEKRYVRLLQGGVPMNHNDLARSERVKFKVAFHLALMLLRIQEKMGKHPGFLIIDTPGTAEVDEADFVAMTRDLVRIHQEYGSQLQILLATARPQALQHLPPEITATPTGAAYF